MNVTWNRQKLLNSTLWKYTIWLKNGQKTLTKKMYGWWIIAWKDKHILHHQRCKLKYCSTPASKAEPLHTYFAPRSRCLILCWACDTGCRCGIQNQTCLTTGSYNCAPEKWAENWGPHKAPHKDVYSSLIHNCPNPAQVKCSQLNKLWYNQTTGYFSVFKRNELSSHTKIWRKFKCRLTRRGQSEKASMIPTVRYSGKDKTKEAVGDQWLPGAWQKKEG